MRRPLVCAATATLALLTPVLVAPSASASESIPDGAWAGSALEAGPTTVTVSSYQLKGTFRRSTIDRQIEIVVSTVPARAGACAVAPLTVPVASTPRSFDQTLSIPCNGEYQIVATATTKDDNAVLGPDTAQLTRDAVQVVAPAPTVTGLELSIDKRVVELTWDDMRPQAVDVSRYLIERKIGDGDFEYLDQVADPDVQEYVDEDLPRKAGTATYRVLAARPSPLGEQVSAAGDDASTPFPAAPTGSGTGGTGGSGGGSGGGSTDGGSDGSGSTDGGSGGGGATGGSTGGRAAPPPRLFAGTFLPPLLRPASESITTTTVDPGFSEELPFGARPPGQVAAAPDRDLGSDEPGEPRRGMLVPVATALVLAVWAFHLRVLARAAARPVG